MLQSHNNTPRTGTSSRAPATSSFDRWLERTQRKGHGKGAVGGDFASRTDGHYHRHADPQTESWGGPAQHVPRNALHDGPAQTRLEELEGLLFTQAHFNRGNAIPDAYAYTDASYTSAIMDGRHITPPQPQPFLSPSQRPLSLPLGDGDFSSLYGAGGLSVLNEPFACGREPFGSAGGGSGEAERYIARLEDEVQALLAESGDRERVTVAAVAARDGLGLQLLEMQWRLEVEREEHAVVQSLTHDFLRRQSFLRLLEERSRAMELNTQISLLKHEVKLAEAMRVQAQTSATTAASSSSAAAVLQRQLEEQHLAQSVTTTVRDLLQQEYTRLSEAMSQMPHKMQSLMEERHTKTAVEAAAAAAKEEGKSVTTTTSPPQQTELNAAETAEQRRLCTLLESALAAVSAQNTASADTAVQSRQPSVMLVQQQQSPRVAGVELTPSDSTHLLSLVKRAHDYQATVLDLYCNAVDTKSSLAQYEMNIVRLIHEKQASLTWAALYEEKKDEVRHLSEKLMEMRGELRAATSTANTNVASPRGWNGVASFAGSTSSQSYEVYAAPYVPPKKKAGAPQQQPPTSGGGSPSVGPLTTVQVRAKVPKKSIEELREEARRLGAHPAVHYPPPVTSPSPSMPSLYVSRTPNAVETTLLQMPSAVLEAARPGTPEQHHAVVAAAPAVRSPVIAQIRSFPAREDSRSSSTASSPVPPPPQPVKAVKPTTPTVATRGSVREESTTPAKKTTPKKTGGSTSVSARLPSPSSLDASSVPSAESPATPVPASRGPQLHMPTLHRVTTTASSSSLSSAQSTSETKPSLGHAASPPTLSQSPPPKAKKATRGTTAAAAVAHNSFDDDNDESEEEVNVKTAAKRPVARAGAATTLNVSPSHTPSLAASGTAALRDAVKTPALQVKRISLDETVRALEKAKRGAAGDDDDDSDADTSSLSLSITSSSSPHVSVAKAKKGSTKPTEKQQRRATAAAAVSPPPPSAKAKHPRRSSFDDDEDSGSELPTKAPPLSSLKARSGVAKTISTNPSAAAPTTRSRSNVPALASAVPAVKTDAVGVSPAPVLAAAAKPRKLKLPTW